MENFFDIKFVVMTGKIGVGKNYISYLIAEELQKIVKYGKTKYSDIDINFCAFSDILKTEVMEKFGFSHIDTFVNKNTHVRRTLINHGTDMRNKHPNYFIDKLQDHIINNFKDKHKYHHTGPVLVVYFITDMRFLNEYKWSIKKKSIIIRVISKTRNNRAILKYEEPNRSKIINDKSETELDFIEKYHDDKLSAYNIILLQNEEHEDINDDINKIIAKILN